MAEAFSLKDQLFNAEKVAYLGGLFASAWDGFNPERFQKDVMAELPALELKQRQKLIGRVLGDHLPDDLQRCFDIVQTALPAPCDPSLSDDDFGDFIFAPLGDLIVSRGLDAPAAALPLLAEVTTRFSMEFALRPFLNHWPEEVFAALDTWVTADHYHLRRLVSEGTRPRLPWGEKVAIDPLRPLPLLDQLHSDPTRFVTRSVANHLNDLSRIHPQDMMNRLETWKTQAAQHGKELSWLTKHALRTLVKDGDTRALAQLGYRQDVPVAATLTASPDPVRIGDAVTLDITLTADSALPVLVDYVMHFHRPNGKTGRKVHKLKQTAIRAGAPLQLSKAHKLKGNASTFTLHPGPHRVELQVNGRILAEAPFELIA
jgi:3-methyladenine DNA glycosylase AlkC